MSLQDDFNKRSRGCDCRAVESLGFGLVTCVNKLHGATLNLSTTMARQGGGKILDYVRTWLSRLPSRCPGRLRAQVSPSALRFSSSQLSPPIVTFSSPHIKSHLSVTLSVQHRDTAWRCYTLASFQHTTLAPPVRLLARVTFAPGASSH
jgi:hypothetical protein